MGKRKELFIATDKQWEIIVENCRLYINKTDILPIAFDKSMYYKPIQPRAFSKKKWRCQPEDQIS
jgi:hypothetical protein